MLSNFDGGSDSSEEKLQTNEVEELEGGSSMPQVLSNLNGNNQLPSEEPPAKTKHHSIHSQTNVAAPNRFKGS